MKQDKRKRLLSLMRSFWKKACIADGMEGNSAFAVFSEGNVYAEAYNRVHELYYRELSKIAEDKKRNPRYLRIV